VLIVTMGFIRQVSAAGRWGRGRDASIGPAAHNSIFVAWDCGLCLSYEVVVVGAQRVCVK
jgi:hypothetical protein